VFERARLYNEGLVTANNATTGEALKFQACDVVLFDGDRLLGRRSYRKIVAPGVVER
jgi:hypothetical protein